MGPMARRLLLTALCLTILFHITPALSAVQCEDPNCITVDDATGRLRPADAVRANLITGYATSTPSGAIIQDVDRGGRPAPKRVKVRRYPLDITVSSTVDVGYGDVLLFTHNGVKYIVNVISFDANNAQLKFMPTREFSNLSPQENKVYDIDHDGTPDFSLTLGTVQDNQAPLQITPATNIPAQQPASTLSSPVESPYTPPQPEPPQQPTAPEPPPQSSTTEVPLPTPAVPPENPPPLSIPAEVATAPPSETLLSDIPETPPSKGISLLTWASILGLLGVIAIGATAVVVLKRERQNVDTLTDYLLRSLARKIPLSTAVESLGQAGWNKRTTDKALTAIATRYKIDAGQKNQSEDQVRGQLAGAGMPEEILDLVFKKKAL